MTDSLIHKRHQRMFGKSQRRKRRVTSSDQILLNFYDKLALYLSEAEHDLRKMARNYPPEIMAELLAGAAETRREIDEQRRDLLVKPGPAPAVNPIRRR